MESELIRAPCEVVFDYRLELANLPRYNPDVTDLRHEAGAYQFRVRLFPGVRWPCRLTVTEADRPRRIRFAIESMFRAEECCSFEETHQGTRVRFETKVASPGGPVGKLLDQLFVIPTLRRQLRQELRLMREQLESGPVDPRCHRENL